MGSKHISLMLMRLKETWGYVELAPSIGEKWACRSHTDEGIGGKYNFRFEGDSPFQATHKAYRTIRRKYAENDKKAMQGIDEMLKFENKY